jgi:hypothetical protein
MACGALQLRIYGAVSSRFLRVALTFKARILIPRARYCLANGELGEKRSRGGGGREFNI